LGVPKALNDDGELADGACPPNEGVLANPKPRDVCPALENDRVGVPNVRPEDEEAKAEGDVDGRPNPKPSGDGRGAVGKGRFEGGC